jgi:hypothetical protein
MNKILGLQRAVWLWGGAAIGVVVLGLVGALILSRGSHDGSAGQSPTADVRPERAPAANIRLTDMTATSGVNFRHDDGGSGEKYLVESVSAGLALLDYDGDGLIDVYFVNGAPLPPRKADPTITNALYRNEGNFQFRDVTREAGVGDPGFGLGVAVGDFDNDGDPDIYVNNFGPNVLYRNNGDGTFEARHGPCRRGLRKSSGGGDLLSRRQWRWPARSLRGELCRHSDRRPCPADD